MSVSTAVTKPIRWQATELPYGRIAYAVETIGTFTLGWAPDVLDSHTPHLARMHVTYGEPHTPHEASSRNEGPIEPDSVPVIHRVRLDACTNTFTVTDAIATLADPEPHANYWLRPLRMTPDHHREPVSDAARARIAWIVARLVEDFLDRDHDGALTAEHLRHHATLRIATHERNIQHARTEIAEWKRRLALEQHHLAIQQRIADGHTAPATWPARPTWRDYRSALTPDGEQFLLSTVGTTPHR